MGEYPLSGLVIYTIGHSTRTLTDFISLLKEYAIRRVIDIRTIPRSRHNPQFNQESLGTALRNRRIAYRHLKELGGLRHPMRDSPNAAWRNDSFRGFADYMQSPEFQQGLERAVAMAAEKRTVLMCAEAVPWRCHRWLVGDALTVQGFVVRHILGPGSIRLHQLSEFARTEGVRITYSSST